ncbi:MAG: 2-oxo acid dehydrogenase subunit E2, partial [Planctomycetes bacterium]|nr:2-oxo acid dehydrogenase subunit E2 [Planctomycetota bacterium]
MSSIVDFEELFGVNAGYVERVFAEYSAQPEAVSEEWQRFFESHLAPEQLPKRTPTKAETLDAERSVAREVEPASTLEPLRGVAAKIAANMTESLTVPTATSTRVVPVKVLEENRRIVNEFLAAEYRGKVSFTHFVAWAMVRALQEIPSMGVSFHDVGGVPHRQELGPINIGIAVDLPRPDGKRSLVVPCIKDCGTMNFATFMAAYTALIQKSRNGKLTPADFQGTTCTLTNPGTIGTVSSLPRLMTGQSFILATGAIGVPAEYEGAGLATLTEIGVSKVMTLTSTYDHRVIQGADSGEYLALLHKLLNGEHGFYDDLFADLCIPYRPIRMERDRVAALGTPQRDSEDAERASKVLQYVRAYRVRGYLLANLDPLVWEARTYPELEMDYYGLTVWDLDRTFPSGLVTRSGFATLREIRDTLRATYTHRVGIEFMHIVDPEQRAWLRERMEESRNEEELPREVQLRVLDSLVAAEAFERFLHTRFVGHKRFSLEGGETLMPVLDALLERAGEHGIHHAVLGMAHRGRLNVLAHVMQKSLTRIFSEFEGSI